MDLCHQHTMLQTLHKRDTFGRYSNLHKTLDNILNQGQKRCGRHSSSVRYVSKNLAILELDKIPHLQHISLEVHRPEDNKYSVMEKVPFPHMSDREILNNWEDTVVIQLPNTCFCFEEVMEEHERVVSSRYVLGINDCRHHALHMLKFCYDL